ncbi:hypothetical protein KC19_7G062900 [Ceratodon purpureus]|uniref:PGG domain-containing protein n=1 Tax=Ceratodon purpureus TaxID=3225 RepID=A0A8T0H3E7_CERPU|nr:hypothetical protein KC19_7G062900 [Ceratodon purpureus]
MEAESCMLEAFVHSCTESQVREFLQNLTGRNKSRIRTHGHVALLHAIESNEDAGVLRALIEEPEIQINLRTEGNTLLHTAVLSRNKDAVIALLKRNDLDPNLKNRRQDTPLHLAAKPCVSTCQDLVDILEMLVNDPRVHLGALNGDKQTAFHIACKHFKGLTSRVMVNIAASVELIVSAGETRLRSLSQFLKLQDGSGRTGLHYASESGLHEVVGRVLNKLGSKSKDAFELALTQDNKGRVAVHFAAERGHFAILQQLIDIGDCKDEKGFTTLHHAIRSGRQDIVQLCFRKAKYSAPGYNSLDKTMSMYLELLRITTHHTIANFLLEDLYSHVDEKRYPSLLHWAVENKDSSNYGALLIAHILKWRPRIANEFLDPATESTALHRAAILENLNAVKALCSENGWYLNANQRDKKNNTALNYAFEMNNKDICRELMQRQDVKEHLSRLHKYRETYVIAANAILVVAVLVATLTYVRCPTVKEAAEARAAGKNNKFRQGDVLVVTRIAFILAMASTILGAFAALPFSFGFFFTQTVDDNYVGKSVKRTRILIVIASYCLILSLAAVVFSFICSQYISPYLDYGDCELACEIVFFLFIAVSALFMSINIARCCKSRRRRAQLPTGWPPLEGV